MPSRPAASALRPEDLADPIKYLADSGFQWGALQAIRYQPSRTDVFPGPSFLVRLWERCHGSGQGKLGPKGILPQLFCGMRDISCEAVVGYLSHQPVVVVGEWRSEDYNGGVFVRDSSSLPSRFHPLGFTFPSNGVAVAAPEHQASNPNALFAGYGFFDDSWGTPQQYVLMYLGLAYLFHEFRLAVIHGTRYHDNYLTARWCRKFGFEDIGGLSHNLYRHDSGLLGPSVVSSLTREKFQARLRTALEASQQEEVEDSQ